jgi:hypothetical protein
MGGIPCAMPATDNKSYRLYEIFGPDLVEHRVSLISRSYADRLVACGQAEEALDVDGKTPCFIWLKPVERVASSRRADSAESGQSGSDVSCAAFSFAEVQAIAGSKFRHGRSRTARMTDEQRARRINRRTGRMLPSEDIVERATNKLKQWNTIGNLLAEVKTVQSLPL